MRRLLVLLVPLALLATGCGAAAHSGQPADREPSVVPAASIAVAPASASASASAPTPTPDPVRPQSFRMWKFHAPVVPLQLSGSELVPPSDPSVVGWWGKRAGAKSGTTLLTGHTVHTGGGELDDLELTPVGSTARVSGIDYQVVSVRILSKAAVAHRAPELFSQHGKPKLVVVTCEGYDASTGRYADNVVVVAKPRGADGETPNR